MKKINKFLLYILIVSVLFSCVSRPRFICDFNDSCPEFSQKIQATKATMQSYISGKNAAYLSINFNSSNVSIYTQNPSINIILKDNGAIIDTFSTGLSYYNHRLSLSNPNAVNNFISTNLGFFSEVSYDVSGIKYISQSGNNNISLDIEYNNDILTGSSWSHYEAPVTCTGIYCQFEN